MTEPAAPPAQAPTTATERVIAAKAAGLLPRRKDVEHSLRECWNLSAREARRFAAEGLRGLGPETPESVADRLLEVLARP